MEDDNPIKPRKRLDWLDHSAEGHGGRREPLSAFFGFFAVIGLIKLAVLIGLVVWLYTA